MQVICLGSASFAAFSWWNTEQKIVPLSKLVDIPTSQVSAESFLSADENDAKYQIKLQSRPVSWINCDRRQTRGVQWAVSESQSVKSWNWFSETFKKRGYSCTHRENITTVEFPLPQLKPHTKYYLQFEAERKGVFTAWVTISLQDSSIANQLQRDKFIAEIGGGFVFAVWLLCFLADCLTIPANSEQPTPHKKSIDFP